MSDKASKQTDLNELQARNTSHKETSLQGEINSDNNKALLPPGYVPPVLRKSFNSNQVHRPRLTPEAVLALQRTVGNQAVLRLIKTRARSIPAVSSVQRTIDEVKKMPGVFWSETPLIKGEGELFLEYYSKKLTGAAEAFLEDLRASPGTVIPRGNEIFNKEWGLARDLAGQEYLLIQGRETSIDLAAYSKHVVFVAHAHPHIPIKSAYSTLNSSELEAKGIRKFYNFSEIENGEAGRNLRQLILPSPADIKYCFNNGLETHSVYTPYYLARLSSPEIKKLQAGNQKAAGEAGAGGDNEQLQNLSPDTWYVFDTGRADYLEKAEKKGPSLRFEIKNPEQLLDKPKHYRCDLIMWAGDAKVAEWSKKRVLADDIKSSQINFVENSDKVTSEGFSWSKPEKK